MRGSKAQGVFVGSAMTEYISAIEKAFSAAREAATVEDARLGEESTRGLDCGFAWVVCKPANGKLAKHLKIYGADKHHTGGVCLWNPSKHPSQSISVKEAGAVAFVKSLERDLKGEGYTLLYYNSRLD